MSNTWKVVVVRAWVDSGVIKARVVSNEGLSQTVGSLEQALGVVEEWLGSLLSGGHGAHPNDEDGSDDAVTPR